MPQMSLVCQSVCQAASRTACLWCLPPLPVSISTWSTRRALLRSLSGCASHLHWLRICSGSIFVVHSPSTLSLLSHFTPPPSLFRFLSLPVSISISNCIQLFVFKRCHENSKLSLNNFIYLRVFSPLLVENFLPAPNATASSTFVIHLFI